MARDPGNIIKGDYTKPIKEITIQEVPPFHVEDFDATEEKEVYRFIRRVENVCRKSFEYKQFISFLKNYGDMNECSFFKNINMNDIQDLRIEIHHEPITLFDIVSTIYNKHLRNGESIHEDMIAKEVMYQHYKLHIGLIPLTQTIHEMVHNQFLFIPTFADFGRWDLFIEEYKDYMPIDTLSNIQSIKDHTEVYDPEEEMKILTAGFVRINTEEPEYNSDTKELYDYLKTVYDDLKAKQIKFSVNN